VRGAVLYGMELASRQNQQIMVPCPRNIGIKMIDYYSRKTHDRKDTYTNELSNQVMVGDLLFVNEERMIEKELGGQFREGGDRCFVLPIYEYLDDDAPDRFRIAHEGTYIR
jgi:hypothetical protein